MSGDSWSWRHPIDSISNWAGKKIDHLETRASNWAKRKIAGIAKSAGESAMSGINSAVQGSSLAPVIGALTGSGGGDNPAAGSDSSGSGLSGIVNNLLGGGGSSNTQSTGDLSSGSGASGFLGKLFGGKSSGILGVIMDLLALVVVALIAGVKGLMGLFGMSKDSTPDTPHDNLIQKGLKGIQHYGNEAYQWMGQKIDKIAGARGIKNNNPGNLEKGQHWKGEVAGSDGRFATFDKALDGLRAVGKNLLAYEKSGFDTTHKIAHRWAPAGDGNNNPDIYSQHLAQNMGVSTDEKLNLKQNPERLASCMEAICRQENGTVPYSHEAFLWAAKAAIDPSYDKVNTPTLVAQNGKYTVESVDPGELLAASKTPQQSSAASGGGVKKPASPSYA
jgi:hypothetical protein